MPETVLTVAAITQRIGGALADLGPLAVRGELAQVKVAPSGHLYATLKDAEARIDLVMWRSQVVRQEPLPKEGQLVVARGSLSVYPPRGGYQLVATRIALLGQGDLAARFEELKARLAAEGLFAEERKRPLPLLPRAVGIATASGSAALADMMDSIRTRFPTMAVVHAPCLVQGRGAAASIVAALRALDAHPEVEVVIAGRGGGSLEDLWAFNEEAVVRQIAAMAKPVISAVGHETDTTLADYAADLRAKTPTEAGELVVPRLAELRRGLDDAGRRLDAAADRRLAALRERLAGLAAHRALSAPGFQVALRRQRLDELHGRLDEAAARTGAGSRERLAALRHRLRGAAPAATLASQRERLAGLDAALGRGLAHRLERAHAQLAAAAGRLDALSPLAVIARGYSVLRTPTGALVRRLDQAPPGSVLEARVEDGWLLAEVHGSRRQRLNEPGEGYQA